jgi:hypothetical protein
MESSNSVNVDGSYDFSSNTTILFDTEGQARVIGIQCDKP